MVDSHFGLDGQVPVAEDPRSKSAEGGRGLPNPVLHFRVRCAGVSECGAEIHKLVRLLELDATNRESRQRVGRGAAELAHDFGFLAVDHKSQSAISIRDGVDGALQGLSREGDEAGVISILKLVDARLSSLRGGLKTTQVKQAAVQPVCDWDTVVLVEGASVQKRDAGEEKVEQYRCQDAALLHTDVDFERIRQLTSYGNSSHHAFVECLQQPQKLGRAAQLGKEIPEQLAIHRIERLRKVNKNSKQIPVLFATFLLELAGDEDHVSRAAISPEPTLSFRQSPIDHETKKTGQHDPSKSFSRNRQKRDSTAVSAVSSIAFPLENGHDSCVLPFLGNRASVPYSGEDVVDPRDEEVATILEQLCRNSVWAGSLSVLESANGMNCLPKRRWGVKLGDFGKGRELL